MKSVNLFLLSLLILASCGDDDFVLNGSTDENLTVETTAPLVSCSAGVLTCNSSSTDVTATSTGEVDFSWTDQNGVVIGNVASINVSAPGTYTVTVTNANGLAAVSSCIITEDTNLPVVACIGGTITCDQPTTEVSTSTLGAVSYSWSGPNGPIAGNTSAITATQAGTYSVTVTAANGCTATSVCTVTKV